MITISLNGESREVAAGCTVESLLAMAGFAQRKVAVEVNREIVPKSLHASHCLETDDKVEIVHAIGGG